MKSKQKTFLGILAAALLVYVGVSIFGLTELDRTGRLGLTVLIFAGGLWVLEPLPLQVTGLIIPVCLVGTGILGIEEAFAPFASPVVFLILGSLFMAEALRKHGLTRRLALDLIVRCNGRPKLLLLAIMAVAGFTSMWIFSTAVVAMLMPVCLTIAGKVEEENQDTFITVLLMALVIGSTLGALGTILGASSNAVASGSLNNITELPP
ncbi:MAG: SLC13 family permease, partial [bacterium]